jgi:hypothetical protein
VIICHEGFFSACLLINYQEVVRNFVKWTAEVGVRLPVMANAKQ